MSRDNNRAIKDAVDSGYGVGTDYRHDDLYDENDGMFDRHGSYNKPIPNRLSQIAHGRTNNPKNNRRFGRKPENQNEQVKNGAKNGDNGGGTSGNTGLPSANPTNNSDASKLKNRLKDGQSKIKSLLSKKKKKEKDKDKKDDNSSNNDNSDKESKSSPLDSLSSGKLKRIKIKIILYGSIILLSLLLFFAVIIAVVSFASNIPILGNLLFGKEFKSVSAEGTKEYNEEVNYYTKLREVKESYEKEHNDIIKTNYIHSVLIYLYYQSSDVEVDEEGNAVSINYKKMTEMIDKIVELMKPEEGKMISYEVGGNFYINLRNSTDIKNYYRSLLSEKDYDTILNEIFDLASDLDEIEVEDKTVITEETKVVVPTPMPEPSKPTTQTTNLSMSDYLISAIYAKTSVNDVKNDELVKAYTVIYSTNVVANNSNLTIDSSSAVVNNTEICNPEKGCSYVNNNGKMVLQSGPGEKSELNNIVYGGKYYYKQPLSSSDLNRMKQSVNSVYGNVLVNSSGSYVNLSLDKIDTSGGTYQEILNNNYKGYSVKNVGEGSYDSGVNYGLLKVQTTVIFYDQNDYADYNFCGKKKETIKSSGCGVTAMAIIASTYEKNKVYDPVLMMKEAKSFGSCGDGITGTSTSFFKKEASKLDYKYLVAGKKKTSDLNLTLKHLSQGHLIIAHMGPGRFTNGGHYIVLGGVDPSTKQVYVYDPYDKVNKVRSKKSGNGWYSFNDIIAKEAYAFYIMWKE